jgi:hypothetical protein
VRYKLSIFIRSSLTCPVQAVPWLRRLFGALPRWRPGFDPRPVRVRCVVDSVAVEQGFLRVFLLYPVSVMSPMLHTLLLHVRVPFTGRTNVRNLGTFQVTVLCRKHWIGKYFHFSSFFKNVMSLQFWNFMLHPER